MNALTSTGYGPKGDLTFDAYGRLADAVSTRATRIVSFRKTTSAWLLIGGLSEKTLFSIASPSAKHSYDGLK